MADEEIRELDRKSGFGTTAVVIAVLAAVIVISMIQNSQEVHIDFLFADMSMSLWFALLLSTAIGFALGWLVAKLRKRD